MNGLMAINLGLDHQNLWSEMGIVIVLPDKEYVPFPSTHKRQAKPVAYSGSLRSGNKTLTIIAFSNRDRNLLLPCVFFVNGYGR